MRSDYLHPLSPSELEDVKSGFSDLKPGHHYEAADLYARYCKAIEGKGRTPVHAVEYGRLLTRFGALRKPKWSKARRAMVKGWII